MKHLLITLGYGNTAAIPVTDPSQAGALIAALSQAVLVKCDGYAADSKYIEEDGNVQIEFVDSSRVVAGNEVDVLRAKLESAEKELTSMRGYWTEEQAKSRALKEQLERTAAA